MSFNDRSPLRQGPYARPRNDYRPGFPGRSERPRIDDRPPLRHDDRDSRFDDRHPGGGFGGGPHRPYERDGPARPFERDVPARPFEREVPARPFERDGPPRSFERDGPPIPFEREVPHRPFERDGPPRSFERDGPPRPFERDGPPRPFERDGPPRPFERDVPPRSFERDGPPRTYERDVPVGPIDRDGPPQRGLERSGVGVMGPRPPAPPAAFNGQASLQSTRTNDVEIIVTHKSLTNYAEFIERRLKNVGLTVDLLFPNEDAPLVRVLSSIASRGSLFAMVVTQLNEQNRTVTVDVLCGETQEHRNMPLDDALGMVVRIFELYMKGAAVPVEPASGAIAVNGAGIPLGNNHPDAIQDMLQLLIKNHTLTVYEYNQLIDYLTTQRNKAAKLDYQGDENAPWFTKEVFDMKKLKEKARKKYQRSKKEEDRLAFNKIRNRLKQTIRNSKLRLEHQKADGNANPEPVKPQADTSDLLKDSIKKAIQNIVQTNYGKGGNNYPKPYGPRN